MKADAVPSPDLPSHYVSECRKGLRQFLNLLCQEELTGEKMDVKMVISQAEAILEVCAKLQRELAATTRIVRDEKKH